MKIQYLLLIATSLLLLTASKCSKTDTEAKEKTSTAIDELKNCRSKVAEDNFWLDNGVREPYQCIENTLGIKALEQMLGEKVFLKGPHKDGINLEAQKEFGHYNPSFLKKAESFLKKAKKDKELNDKIQYIYNLQLKSTLRLYYLAYDQPTEEIIEKYKEIVAEADPNCEGFLCEPSSYLQEIFRDFAEQKETEGYSVYTAFVAPGFWVRRNIDGTSAQFHNLLKQLFETYDAEFLK